jgi:hypothetical protein
MSDAHGTTEVNPMALCARTYVPHRHRLVRRIRRQVLEITSVLRSGSTDRAVGGIHGSARNQRRAGEGRGMIGLRFFELYTQGTLCWTAAG